MIEFGAEQARFRASSLPEPAKNLHRISSFGGASVGQGTPAAAGFPMPELGSAQTEWRRALVPLASGLHQFMATRGSMWVDQFAAGCLCCAESGEGFEALDGAPSNSIPRDRLRRPPGSSRMAAGVSPACHRPDLAEPSRSGHGRAARAGQADGQRLPAHDGAGRRDQLHRLSSGTEPRALEGSCAGPDPAHDP